MKSQLQARPANVLFALLTVSSLVLAVWFGFEEVLLSKGKRPITWYGRRLVNKYWAIGRSIEILGSVTFGIAVTHFIIDSDQQPPGR